MSTMQPAKGSLAQEHEEFARNFDEAMADRTSEAPAVPAIRAQADDETLDSGSGSSTQGA